MLILSISPLTVAVVLQHLGGGKGVNGGKAHDDFVNEWGVLDAFEDVLIFVGKQLHFCR